jgi:Rrf2 family protein
MFQLGEHVEWGLHCAVIMTGLPEGEALPAAALARHHGIPPAYLAKALQVLSRAGLIAALPGRNGGYRLARDPSTITFLDIVDALEGAGPFFRCREIRRGEWKGPLRGTCAIAAAMYRAESAWRAELAATSIAEIAEGLGADRTRALQQRVRSVRGR